MEVRASVGRARRDVDVEELALEYRATIRGGVGGSYRGPTVSIHIYLERGGPPKKERGLALSINEVGRRCLFLAPPLENKVVAAVSFLLEVRLNRVRALGVRHRERHGRQLSRTYAWL